MFKVENVPLFQFISKFLQWRVKYFSAFLILGTMSIMVSRWIFDIRANYVERFVIISGYCEFSRRKMYLSTNLSQISTMEGELFGAFLILGTMSTTVLRRIFDKRANYVERFVKTRDIANFLGGKCTLHQFISKSLRWRVKYFGHF